jgi:hypothetical protein
VSVIGFSLSVVNHPMPFESSWPVVSVQRSGLGAGRAISDENAAATTGRIGTTGRP